MENEAGALFRVAGLFSARGYNIESLTVAPTDDDTLSRLTVVTRGSNDIVEQIIKQLNKLVDVVKLMDLTEHAHIEREMMMIKVEVGSMEAKQDVKRLSDIFRSNIIDVTPSTFTIEMTGDGKKLDAFITALNEHPIIEVVRSGAMGIARGEKALHL
jgi:acetolactate synthase-1/3 small subunit